jgi:hypothetical protein
MSLRPQSVFVACTPALLVLCAGAHPQSPPYVQVDNTVELPQLTGSITRTCTGDIDGDFAADVALLSGGKVFVGFGISAHKSVVEVVQAGPAIDLALTPRMLGEPRCQLAVTRTDGVFLVGRQPDPQHPVPWVVEPVLASDSSLKGAKWVRSADLDGNNRSDLMVVLANEKTVRVLLRQLDGSWSTALAPFTLATKVLDVVGLQYDADTPLELAIQTEGSARVHEVNGTFVAMARNATSGAPAGMAVMPVQDTTRSRVAYLATATGGGYELHLLEYLIGLESLHVGNLVPRALLAGDHDGDGDHDLLVDHGESGALTLLLSDEDAGAGCGPNPDHYFSCQLGDQDPFYAVQEGVVMQAMGWSDLDNDGSPDLLVPSSDESSESWMVEFRPRVPAPQGAGPFGLPGDHPVFYEVHWADPSSGVSPQLRLHVTNVWPDEALREWLQVTVWRKQNPPVNQQGPGTETIGRFNGFYARSSSVGTLTDYELTLPDDTAGGMGTNYTPFQLVSGSLAAHGADTTLYFVEVRSVQLDVNYEIVSAGRKQIAGLALNQAGPSPSGTSASYLAGLPGSWGISVSTSAFEAGFNDPIPGNYKIGGLVPMPDMPAFAPGFLVYTEPVIIP